MELTVIKRNNEERPFEFDKIYNHILECSKDLDVDPNDLVQNMKIRTKDKMKTTDIQHSLIFAAADLIDKKNPDWQFAAARLLLQSMYKDIYGSYDPHFNYNTLKTRIKKGYYDKEVLDHYSEEEFNDLCSIIDYSKDQTFTYLGLNQMMKKYSIKRKNVIIETPQEIFFMIPMYIFARIKNKAFRESIIKLYYKKLSNFDIFLSTPPMIGIRTTMRGFTSCAGVAYGDSIESLGNASKTMFKLITKLRAGIGGDPASIRGLDADIGDGVEKHTGITPYLKVYESISRSSTQPNSGRSGAITNYYPFFHWEIENILLLKNNKGSEEASVRFSDHAIMVNELFYERVINNKEITLFHPNEVQDLIENIGEDNFKEQYEALERKRNIVKKKINAVDLYDRYFNERYSTARIYKTNSNEMQRHGAFDLPNYKSNLCLEINLPSFPDENFVFKTDNPEAVNVYIEKLYEEGKWYNLYKHIKYKVMDDTNRDVVTDFNALINNGEEEVKLNFGETFSCILGGFNMGSLNKDVTKRRKQIKDIMKLQVNFLDEMIDYQDYADIDTFERFTKNRRALGISPGNLFYLLAQHNYDYNSQEARDLINDIMEEVLYYGIEASMKLAKIKGPCKYFNDTKYSKGIFPIDTYNKNVDLLASEELKMDWDVLRKEVSEHGMRNSALLTAVPSSNSSRPGNMISGINPPQAIEYNVEDQKMKISGLLPESKKYEEFYERNSAWNLDVIEYWKLIAVFQKFIDQAISLNEYVDFTKFEGKKIPQSEVYRRDMFMRKYGIKSIYYAKTKTDIDGKELSASADSTDEACASGGCTL